MSSKSDRFKEELEQTQMLKTMIIESDEEEPSILEEIEEFEEKIDNIRKANEHAPEGSLASKADMVRRFNEMNK